jgi:hypothetical protein
MSLVTVAGVAILLVTFGAAAVLAVGAWAWMRRVPVRRRASPPVGEPRAARRCGWSLDLSDEE